MSEFPAIAGAFGPDFTWGVSTASYQIEGGVAEGGRGRSTWDTFCDQPGRIKDGDTGEVACDHYHRYPEDIALMADLGLDAYRFSFAWPRIQPDATGAVNAEGLAFYDRLIDGLLAKGIEPVPTLFHWDTPQALEDEDGWLNRDITDRFADYASVLATHFGDRVKRWMTLNEPVVVTLLGHAIGMHAPGKTLGFESLSVAHHQLLAHGKAVQAMRAAGVGNIGIANNHAPIWRADESPEAEQAAAFYDTIYNRLFADPILLGEWPMEGLELGLPGLPGLRPGDDLDADRLVRHQLLQPAAHRPARQQRRRQQPRARPCAVPVGAAVRVHGHHRLRAQRLRLADHPGRLHRAARRG